MANTYDLIIHQVRPIFSDEIVDVGIKGNTIVDVQKDITANATHEIDGKHNVISPGFVDAHMHLDKAFMGGEKAWGCQTLWDSIHLASEIMQQGWDVEEIYLRGMKAAKLAIKNGTTALRTHVDVSTNTGLAGIEAISRVKKEMQDYVTIQIVAFGGQGFTRSEDANEGLLRESLKIGADVLGIFANADKDPIPYYDMAFDVAKAFNVEIDAHVDETNDPNIRCVESLAEKTIENQWQGRVAGSHVCSLSAMSESDAKPIMAKIAQAKMWVITNPLSNLYIHGSDETRSTGLTRVKQLLDLGVPIAMGTDNTRDVFCPMGSADMVQNALFLAYQERLSQGSMVHQAFELATLAGSHLLNLQPGYGISTGARADLVIMDAKTPEEALIHQKPRTHVIKDGKFVVDNYKLLVD